MKVRAKFTSYMESGVDKGKAWIIKDKIYELNKIKGCGEYEFKSEISEYHYLEEEDLDKYFNRIIHNIPKICQILNVELEQPFNIKGIACNPCRVQDFTYHVVDKNDEILPAKHLLRAINDTSLVEKIEYTDEQKEIFKALKTLGYNYIARDSDYSIYAFEKKPVKKLKYYWSSDDIVSFELETSKILNAPYLNFINWEDEEPFEIPEV